MSRCTQIPESRLFVFNLSPEFSCIVTVLKARTKFRLKLVRDIGTKNDTVLFSLH